MARKKKPAESLKPDNALHVEQSPDETGAQAVARKLLQPDFRNGAVGAAFTEKMLGDKLELPGISDYAVEMEFIGDRAAEGDLGFASRMLATQAVALDSMYAELARRSASNLGKFVDAAERYGRLALRAQTNCRTTLEALAKLHQPREQTVRHVHVNEGGQAVVADHFHNHTGGEANAKTDEQSRATRTASESPAMLGKDAQGNGVPVSSGERAEAVQNARRDQSRRA